MMSKEELLHERKNNRYFIYLFGVISLLFSFIGIYWFVLGHIADSLYVLIFALLEYLAMMAIGLKNQFISLALIMREKEP